jgi:hypothetical protein
MKEKIIEEIKALISVGDEKIDINPNYLDFFDEDELNSIKNQLLEKKSKYEDRTSSYLDEIYEKTKKDEL